jgi:hypothetical protein
MEQTELESQTSGGEGRKDKEISGLAFYVANDYVTGA